MSSRSPAEEAGRLLSTSGYSLGRLLKHIRPAEVQRLIDRAVFVQQLETFQEHVAKNDLDLAEISVGIGLNPDTLRTAFSDSMVGRQLRFNHSMLSRALDFVGLDVPDALVRYLDKGRGD